MTQASANVNIMIKAARKAGRSLLRDFGEVEQLQVSAKGPGDFVSRADIKAEELIRTELTEARPNYGWVGEESSEVKGADPTRRWLVDPLDGTTNFLHGLPHWAVSIGLEHKGGWWPASSTTPSRTRSSSPRRARAPGSTTGGCGSRGGAT
jgi:myo-inositol-1(or 4)-monophosphatase